MPESDIDRVREAADIVSVVSEHVALRPAGRRLTGLCPFHGDSKPSFMVNPERQTWHCFGCHEGGNVFTFVMRVTNLTFPEAVRDLAGRFGVSVTERRGGEGDSRRREELLAVNQAAAEFYEDVLWGDRGREGRDYIEKTRGLSLSLAKRFRLGMALEGWDHLARHLARQGVDPKLAASTGLLRSKRPGRYYDLFRHRLMFPIRDGQGRVVGFGGRTLGDDDAKYLNSPESPVFDKKSTLYGLDQTRKAILAARRAIVVEGYLDLLSLYQAKVEAVVAPMGTALSRGHVRRLKGLGREAVLVFDGDAAGVQAALRSLPFFLAEGAPARVVLLPQGEDPDSFVRTRTAAAFMDLVDAAPLMMDFAIDRVVARCDGTKQGRAEAVGRMRPLLRAVSDPVELSLHVRDLARRLAVDEHAVQAALAGADRPWGREAAGEPDQGQGPLPNKVLDTLAVAVSDPAARERLLESGALRELVGEGRVLALVEAIESLDEVAGAAWPADLISRLTDDQLPSLVASLEERSVREADRLVEDLVIHGRQRQIKSELAELRQEMLEAQAAGDEARETEAVARARLLQRQLNNPSEAHV
ncbi:MAG: DNA primase [Proteobacteria bacterium]|nr:DNA primase [Pseudomonadota bacterium]